MLQSHMNCFFSIEQVMQSSLSTCNIQLCFLVWRLVWNEFSWSIKSREMSVFFVSHAAIKRYHRHRLLTSKARCECMSLIGHLGICTHCYQPLFTLSINANNKGRHCKVFQVIMLFLSSVFQIRIEINQKWHHWCHGNRYNHYCRYAHAWNECKHKIWI